MTDVGEPVREIEVQPLEDPIPRERPAEPEPERPAERPKKPELVPA
jgi:hypothetical protein